MENIEALLAAVAAQTQGFDDDEPAVSTGLDVGSGNYESSPGIQEVSGRTKLNSGFSGDTQANSLVAATLPIQAAVPSTSVSATGTGAKKRRGRPPKVQMANSPPLKKVKIEDEEEDVCFICFDGGSLVLCDRKGCPKAYHPGCIKRDEEFFRSKAKWNCGWHICTVCRKASHYICYTCPYSLCKGCTKDTDYLLVRGNKGFCSTCMKIIMLIEKIDHASNESIQVDFDDITSWEYLFKIYWACLKEKLSLSLVELEHAKKPPNPVVSVASKRQLNRVLRTGVDGRVSISRGSGETSESNKSHVQIKPIQNDGDSSVKPSSIISFVEKKEPIAEHNTTQLELNTPHQTRQLDEPWTDFSTSRVQNCGDIKLGSDKESTGLHKGGEWASKDLLEFLGQVRNGDISVMSQFDVQTLLLEYIKKNLLRDPHQKSQIICDSRLKILFGKSRIGHFEMLKLLEHHVLIKDDSLKTSVVPAGFVCSGASENEVEKNIREASLSVNSRKRKSNRKNQQRVLNDDSNEYAAIDIHNINLIYLRRNLVENLSANRNDFNDKVIDSIVRIRVASNDQKQDLYRLVQVVGTSDASEPYKSGDTTVNVMLQVLNLDKKELVSIDVISNQDFTEDECRRLRQSIRCGVVKQLTVGEVQKKAMALQTIKVNDWLETEMQRLKHLRDRASENGRKKELRECIEKLHLLNSPKERQLRISQVPEVHADRKMDPNYKSEEDDKTRLTIKKDEHMIQSPVSHRNGRRRISQRIKGKEELSKQERNKRNPESETNKSNEHISVCNRGEDQVTACKLMQNSVEETLVGPSDHIETERLWHYRDPNGRIQGPFSMMQLRKWNTTGLFPPETRIWTNHEQYDSLLLSDALNGQFHASSESEENILAVGSKASEFTNQNSENCAKTLTSSCDIETDLPEKSCGGVAAESTWPQCWDLLKDDVEAQTNVTLTEQCTKFDELVDKNTQHGVAQNSLFFEDRTEEIARPLDIDLESVSVASPSSKNLGNTFVFDLPSPNQSAQKTGILELLSPAPRSNTEEDQRATEAINSEPSRSSVEPNWSIASNLVLGATEEWDDSNLMYTAASSSKPPDPPPQNIPSWLVTHEPIEFDAFGEESVSDLLAEVDAMESQGGLASPNSALKFAKELLEDCKDDCFSSIDEFNGSDVLSSTQSNIDAFDFFGKANSQSYPQGETAASEAMETGWGNVQGNINLVTVQGNVNLVLGGPVQGMSNLNWVNSQITHSRNSMISRENQRKFSRNRQQYGNGYSRTVPKGQRVCKFYESGHCKKGASCDYFHA